MLRIFICPKNRVSLKALKQAGFKAKSQGITGQKGLKKTLKSKNTGSFFQDKRQVTKLIT